MAEKSIGRASTRRAQAQKPPENGVAPLVNRIKPVSNAINIIRYLGQQSQSTTVTQIARQLKINPSTCFNILRTLVWEELVNFDEASKTYSIGLGVVRLAEGVMSEGERLNRLRPAMHEVAERHRVTILLWRRIGTDRMLLVLTENSSADLQIHLPPGQRLPFLIGATGRAVALHLGLSKEEIRARFRELRWNRRLSFEAYWAEAKAAAERGWAVDEGFFASGTTTVAAPVLDAQGQVSHSVVAIMFRGQHEQRGIRLIAQDLVKLSADIARKLR